jgi:hypothetical protein
LKTLALLVLFASSLAAQKQITGVTTGGAVVTVTPALLQNVKLDSLHLRVIANPPVRVDIWRGFLNGVGQKFDSVLAIGDKGCLYVTAQDKNGVYITGLRPVLTSSNPAVVALSQSATCPDTTVDPMRFMNTTQLQNQKKAAPKRPPLK